MEKKFEKIITIVMDSVGVGEAPDAADFGDFGVNTVGNIAKIEGLNVPNLSSLGLSKLVSDVKYDGDIIGKYGKMQEVGAGKDTLTGHLEMMGSTVKESFGQFVEKGFPDELIAEFEAKTGKKVLANKEANGMKVIKEFYKEHIETGAFIVYTSIDSTFQIAAHEDVISLDELYKACEIARELTKDKKYNVARVIARPFLGDYENFYRTSNRHDYALSPKCTTVMEKLISSGYESIAVGKIADIFNNVGVSKSIKTVDNMDGVDKTIELIKDESIKGHIFTNLVDFDMKFGHPRDVLGYKNALEEFDSRIPEILNALGENELLIITADHGNDPTYKGNDHTREYVPLLIFYKGINKDTQIDTRKTFEDLGETICENFELESTNYGTSFLEKITN